MIRATTKREDIMRSTIAATLAVLLWTGVSYAAAGETAPVSRGGGAAPAWSTDATLWDSGAYVYDAAGNIVAIGDDHYSYDQAGRLLSATTTAGTSQPRYEQTFAYDRFGNLLQVTKTQAGTPPETFESHVDAQTNRLPNGDYDAAGNQRRNVLNTNITYGWDELGMMQARYEVGGQPEQYVYDANDERVLVLAGTQRRYSLRGPDNKVAREFVEEQGVWRIEHDYIYRGGTLLASFTAQDPERQPSRHFHADHLGTPRLVTDAHAQQVGVHAYFPFGSEATPPESEERLKFTGHERDAAGDPRSEMDYMHARYYAPGTGRFLSVDPLRWIDLQDGSDEERQQFREFIANPQNFNMYVYVANDPMNRTDPLGLRGCQAGDRKFDTCTITIVYNRKTSKGTLTVTGQNKGDTDGTVLLTTDVVVGGDGHVTPTGTFTASVWEKDHVSTKYGSAADTPWSKTRFGGNAFGPYQLHIKEFEKRGIYIHGTMGPRWSPTTWGNRLLSATSHGCVRMCNADIFKLHDMMPEPKGNKIIISSH